APIFPRTQLLAQYHGVTQAAARVHDDHIGVGRVYHLFRLPEDLERSLHFALQEEPVVKAIGGLVTNRETALEHLVQCGISSRHAGSEGPTLIADEAALRDQPPWKTVAGCYAEAFKKGTRVYPYFSGAQ